MLIFPIRSGNSVELHNGDYIMQNVTNLVELSKVLISDMEAYTSKPTKVASKKIRATITDMQKLMVASKKDMMEADKNQTK